MCPPLYGVPLTATKTCNVSTTTLNISIVLSSTSVSRTTAQSVYLDTVGSYNQNVAPALRSTQSLQYRWLCALQSGSNFDLSQAYTTTDTLCSTCAICNCDISSSSLLIPANSASAGAYVLSVFITASDGAATFSPTISVTYTVPSLPAPLLSFRTPSSPATLALPVHFYALATSTMSPVTDGSLLKYQWQSVGGAVNIVDPSVCVTSSTPNSPNLVIAAGALAPGLSYYFIVTVTDVNGASTASSQAEVTMDVAPYNGVCVLSYAGIVYALMTPVTATCFNWTSHDGTPLNYTFSYITDSQPNSIILLQTSSSVSTSNFELASGVVTVYIGIADSLGSTTTWFQQLDVVPADPCTFNNVTLQVQTLITEQSFTQAAQLLFSLAVEMASLQAPPKCVVQSILQIEIAMLTSMQRLETSDQVDPTTLVAPLLLLTNTTTNPGLLQNITAYALSVQLTSDIVEAQVLADSQSSALATLSNTTFQETATLISNIMWASPCGSLLDDAIALLKTLLQTQAFNSYTDTQPQTLFTAEFSAFGITVSANRDVTLDVSSLGDDNLNLTIPAAALQCDLGGSSAVSADSIDTASTNTACATMNILVIQYGDSLTQCNGQTGSDIVNAGTLSISITNSDGSPHAVNSSNIAISFNQAVNAAVTSPNSTCIGGKKASYNCVYFDPFTNNVSSSGCVGSSVFYLPHNGIQQAYIRCTCNHLTEFGVLFP